MGISKQRNQARAYNIPEINQAFPSNKLFKVFVKGPDDGPADEPVNGTPEGIAAEKSGLCSTVPV